MAGVRKPQVRNGPEGVGGGRCGCGSGLSFAHLPLFITAAGRHNIDKGLRRLAAEILCDASEVCRLVERGAAHGGVGGVGGGGRKEEPTSFE